MRIKSESIVGQPETSIVFYSTGGHDHDGVNSTLINTQQYSILDFNIGQLGNNPQRKSLQDKNLISLKNLIISTVNENVLTPAGIKLSSNSITADAIVASTITATELASEIVLVRNVIKSTNFDGTIDNTGAITSPGTTGWAITYSGDASFNDVAVRGTIEANSGNIAGWGIGTSVLTSTGSVTQLYSNGLAKFGSNTYLYPNGLIQSNSLVSTSGTIGPFTVNPSYLSVASTFLRSNGAISVANLTEIAANGNIILNTGSVQYLSLPPSSTGLNATWTGGSPYILSQAAYSSRKFKNSIQPLDENFNSDKLLNLEVVQFKYNEDYLPETDQFYNKYIAGLIAEDVFETYPTAAVLDSNGEPLSVSYINLIAPLIDLVQKMEKRITSLEEEVSVLKGIFEV